MSRVFVDTWFYLAALNPADPNHTRAIAAGHRERRHRITTDWILVEVGDALCSHGNRDVFARFYDWIHEDAGTAIVPATRQLLEDGVHLYRRRRDKSWPLTDCISLL